MMVFSPASSTDRLSLSLPLPLAPSRSVSITSMQTRSSIFPFGSASILRICIRAHWKAKQNQDAFCFYSSFHWQLQNEPHVSRLLVIRTQNISHIFSTFGLKKTFDHCPLTLERDETKGSLIWRPIWEAMQFSFQCRLNDIISKIFFFHHIEHGSKTNNKTKTSRLYWLLAHCSGLPALKSHQYIKN